MSVTDLEEARRAAGIDTEQALLNGGHAEESASAAERAEAGPTQEELFPTGSLAGDPKKTLKNLVRAGAPTKLTASLDRAEVPMRGGLIDFEASGEVLVTFEAGKLELAPTVEQREDGSRRLTEVKARQNLRAVYVQPADQMFTREQVLDMLHSAGASVAQVTELLGEEPAA